MTDVKAVPQEMADAIDKSLGLTMISIRLHASLIEDFKLVAAIHSCQYQPLMREALKEWIDAKKTDLLRGVVQDVKGRGE